ncbi:DUF3784 domain-containing protein [uncultured Psychroserpens sp.]|uniref:DUF3784 domain-containing protein n=1 Tax=uncultured Psychroserpens sp. TaxID=255436 RepID=UPI002615E622|nr:DUF3784 domain-containing protein [uncultured Psychroserpens sp.]
MAISVAILFIILGVLIKYAKMYYLIAGYNTMSKKEQAKYDIDGIATVFRNAMFGMALLMIIGYVLSIWLKDPKLEVYGVIIAVIIGLPYLLIVSNSGKYKVDKEN